MTPTRRQLRLQRRPSPAPPPRSVQLLDPGLYDAPASYSRLQILATTHAQLIASRWRKKKVALRTKSITRAWAATVEARSSILNNPTPAEPPRGPIAQAPPKLSQQIFMASNTTAPHESPMQHLAVADYLYSTSINLENLAQSPAPLLNLLYTRSTRSPAQLGRWDYINVVEPLLHLFKITEQGPWDFDDGIMDVAVIGRWAAEYGLIKSWSKKSLDFISGLTGKNVVKLEPQGKYLFRWQKVLLDFCINCVLDILDTEANRITDIDFTQKASTVDKTPLELLIKDVGTISQANTQAGISNSRALGLKMQLYSPPEKFDFRHAYRLAITMLREAQDHVDLLRSDPRYFLDQTSALIDHRVEHIPDLQGHKGNPHSVESVQDSVNKLIHNSYSRLVIFNEIVLQFEDVNELCIDSRGEANDRLDEAISAIRDLLSMIEGFLGTMLRISALAGPQLRGYFQRIQTPSFPGEVSILSNTSPATVYRENPIAGILMSTAAQSQGGWEKNVFNLRRISDEVERELLENPQLKETIHPWVMGVLGMAASVYELMDALDAYVPCGGLNSEQDLNPTAQVTSAINSFGKIMPTLELKSFFGSTNNGWEALQKVETLPGGLKTLWEKVDREVAKLSPDGNTLAEWVGASQGRLAKKRKGKWTWQGQVWFAEGAAEDDNAELHQDASHLPELIPIEPFEDGGYGKDTWLVCDVPLPDSRENRPPAVTVRRPKPRLPPSQNEPLRPFGVNAEGSTGLVPDAEQAPKQKIKTRGTTTEKGDDGDGKPAHAPTVEPQGKISVSNRAYQLLVQLATASAPVAWKDFLYLMVHLGFSSIPVGGSVFRFDPAGMDLGDESISIHRPHPESEYSKGKCRQIWTRLKKNYGWDIKRFCVRENGPEES